MRNGTAKVKARWVLLAGMIGVGSYVALRACGDHAEQAQSKPPPKDPRKTCSSNADCAGGLVCVTRESGTRCEENPLVAPAPQRPNNPATCLPAAKRLLDKAYACGFATVGVTDVHLCGVTTYARILDLEALNCREMLNFLAATIK
jgi:hypothetical protein